MVAHVNGIALEDTADELVQLGHSVSVVVNQVKVLCVLCGVSSQIRRGVGGNVVVRVVRVGNYLQRKHNLLRRLHNIIILAIESCHYEVIPNPLLAV